MLGITNKLQLMEITIARDFNYIFISHFVFIILIPCIIIFFSFIGYLLIRYTLKYPCPENNDKKNRDYKWK